MEWFQNLTVPQATLIGLLITGLIFPVVSFLLNKFFNKKVDDVGIGEKLQGMFNNAIDGTNRAIQELENEREARRVESEAWEKKYSAMEAEWEKKHSAVEKRLKEIEQMQSGPFSLETVTEFVTSPEPKVIRQHHKLTLIKLDQPVQ